VIDNPQQTPAHWSQAVKDAFWTAVNAPTYDESAAATLAFAQMLPAVSPPLATDRATLHDRIADALYAHSHPGWATRYADLDRDERETYLARASAVLAVLPTDLAQTIEHRDYWHQEAMCATARIVELERAAGPGGVADEEQPKTCGRTRDISGNEHPPCRRAPGHGEAYCRNADGNAYFLAVNADQPAEDSSAPAVEPCPPGCIACATDESHDPAPAAGARQDGAQQ
jgi:hypothetical protein